MKLLRSDGGLFALIVAVLVSGLVLGRALLTARTELSTARMYHEQDEIARAVQHYRRALRWSVPFNPYEAEAVSALQSVAEELERAGDRTGALLAWRSLAGGLASTRVPWSRSSRAREEAKDQIARLLVLEGGAPIDANLDDDRLGAEYRRLLDREASPNPPWGTILLVGFAVWMASLALFIRRGFDSKGRLRPKAAQGALWAALGGWVSFVLGLLFA